MREKEEQERIEREAEDKRKRMLMEEQEKKEQERLAAIALEKKRREEELTMILNQIFELEKTESELESKKDEIEKEGIYIDAFLGKNGGYQLRSKIEIPSILFNQNDIEIINKAINENILTRLGYLFNFIIS